MCVSTHLSPIEKHLVREEGRGEEGREMEGGREGWTDGARLHRSSLSWEALRDSMRVQGKSRKMDPAYVQFPLPRSLREGHARGPRAIWMLILGWGPSAQLFLFSQHQTRVTMPPPEH